MDIATTPRPLEGLPAWTRDEFEAQLRDKGRSYHIHHPFNVRMNAGGCTPDELRCWVANRFYYQVCIPRKDAAILANMPDRAHRRLWVERILDHDGYGDFEGSASGGLEAWIRLGEAVGIARDDLLSLQGVVPAVRFACDAYVNFAAKAPWQEAVCSSLTEMFAPQIHKDRLATWPTHYPWINADGLGYFRKRIPLAGRDVEHGLRVTLDHFTTRAEQHRALDILQFKLDVLWTMLDAIEKGLPVIPTHPKLSRRFRLQYEEAQTRWVLLYPEGMVQLNDSAAEILKRCDGERTVAEIVGELEAAFSVQGLTPQVESLLEEGGRRGWIE